MEDLKQIIERGESQNLEFKEVLPEKSEKYIKTIIAYANTSGGKLIIGVEDKTYKIVGIKTSDLSVVIDSLTNAIADCIKPQLIPDVSTAVIDGKTVIVVEVFPGMARPYHIASQGVENGTYIRVNATTRLADEVMLKELQLQGCGESFDKTIIPGKIVTEKEAEELCSAIKNYRKAVLEERDQTSDNKDITLANLENWNLLKREKDYYLPTIAYDLLTKNTRRFAKIQCGLFKGNDRVLFLDKKEFDGPIYNQIEDAHAFVLKHINLEAKIEGLYRYEKYELPPDAIREAIANAVTHRNYMENACVQVCVYDNRVEITSPGMLYGGLTLDLMKSGHTRIRNEVIAEVFSRMYVIEGWGTGINRMITECRKYDVPIPVFSEMGTDFRVEFFRKVSPSVSVVTDNVTDNVTETEILKLIIGNGKITTTLLAQTIGVSRMTISRYIKSLKDCGKIERIGSDRDGYWKVNL